MNKEDKHAEMLKFKNENQSAPRVKLGALFRIIITDNRAQCQYLRDSNSALYRKGVVQTERRGSDVRSGFTCALGSHLCSCETGSVCHVCRTNVTMVNKKPSLNG